MPTWAGSLASAFVAFEDRASAEESERRPATVFRFRTKRAQRLASKSLSPNQASHSRVVSPRPDLHAGCCEVVPVFPIQIRSSGGTHTQPAAAHTIARQQQLPACLCRIKSVVGRVARESDDDALRRSQADQFVDGDLIDAAGRGRKCIGRLAGGSGQPTHAQQRPCVCMHGVARSIIIWGVGGKGASVSLQSADRFRSPPHPQPPSGIGSRAPPPPAHIHTHMSIAAGSGGC